MKSIVVLSSVLVCLALLSVFATAYAEEKRTIHGSDEETSKTKEATKKHTGQEVWVVSQATDNQKSYTVCVNKDGFKFISGDIGILSTAPEWQVCLINKKMKTYWKMPTKQFAGLEGVERFDIDSLEPPSPKTETSPQNLAGQTVTEYTAKPKYSAEKTRKMGINAVEVDVATANELPVQPEARLLLEHLYGIKGLQGVPLRITLKNDKGVSVDCLSTNWCIKRFSNNDFFLVPKKYKEAVNESEVEHPPVLKPLRPGQIRRDPPPKITRFKKGRKDSNKNGK